MKRDPNGHFISRESALFHWLPLMLSWIYREPLESMLERAAHWCTKEAAEELALNARYLTQNPDERVWWRQPLERVELWKRRREVLFETIEKLRAIK